MHGCSGIFVEAQKKLKFLRPLEIEPFFRKILYRSRVPILVRITLIGCWEERKRPSERTLNLNRNDIR
jgi:hypothetical protein